MTSREITFSNLGFLLFFAKLRAKNDALSYTLSKAPEDMLKPILLPLLPKIQNRMKKFLLELIQQDF